MKNPKRILTIAGFDPSGGAGILADIKAYQKLKCLGNAVITANTFQTEKEFRAVNWIDETIVFDQLDLLLNTYKFDGVKIGILPSVDFLSKLLDRVKAVQPKSIILWDPVLSASVGFDFNVNLHGLSNVFEKLDWITPNWGEVQKLSGCDDSVEGAKLLSKKVNVYLKGGHNTKDLGKDFIVQNEGLRALNPKPGKYSEKHGSGCVFSSALLAHFVKGFPVQKASLKAKRYIEHYLKSSDELIGIQ